MDERICAQKHYYCHVCDGVFTVNKLSNAEEKRRKKKCCNKPPASYILYDVYWQLKLVLSNHLNDILQYHQTMLHSDNGDVLCGSSNLHVDDVLHLHLHVSTDGGNPFTKGNFTLWLLKGMLTLRFRILHN